MPAESAGRICCCRSRAPCGLTNPTIEPFRPPSKLRSLQALDDEPEPLHLGARRRKLRVVVDHLRGKLAHQPMQGIDIDRQRGEIEIHARESNTGRQRRS